jgi:putative FmdB family regulatory protein
MPTYDYVCQECGHELETFQSMNDEPLSECPSCKGRLKRKVGGGSGIIFKGSGFYINDSKKAAAKPAEPSAASGAKASE